MFHQKYYQTHYFSIVSIFFDFIFGKKRFSVTFLETASAPAFSILLFYSIIIIGVGDRRLTFNALHLRASVSFGPTYYITQKKKKKQIKPAENIPETAFRPTAAQFGQALQHNQALIVCIIHKFCDTNSFYIQCVRWLHLNTIFYTNITHLGISSYTFL